MQLEKFNLPRIIVDALSCAAPEVQGQVYAALFSFIYNGKADAGDSLAGHARALYLLAKAVVEPMVARAVRAAERKAASKRSVQQEPVKEIAVQPEPGPAPALKAAEEVPAGQRVEAAEALAESCGNHPALPTPLRPKKPMLIPPGARRRRAAELYKKRHG